MAVYRFRVSLEDNSDIYRDIEIKSVQSFEDLHNSIQEAFKFDKKHTASFFVSDDYWRKGQEITLREEDLNLDAEEIRKKVSPKLLMSANKIAKHIDAPRQKFLYVFDPNVKWAFTVELIKILPDDPKVNYPACVKTVGNAPKQYKQTKIIQDELDAAGLVDDAHDSDHDEDTIYKNLKEEEHGIDDDDLNNMEGEEGEDEPEGDTEDNMEDGEDDSIMQGHDDDERY